MVATGRDTRCVRADVESAYSPKNEVLRSPNVGLDVPFRIPMRNKALFTVFCGPCPKSRFFSYGERRDRKKRQMRSARCAIRVITGRGKLSCTLICVSYVLVSRARAPRAVASGRRGVYLRSSVLSDALCKVLEGGYGVRRRLSTSAGDVFSLTDVGSAGFAAHTHKYEDEP